jgi:hypothetical protein
LAAVAGNNDCKGCDTKLREEHQWLNEIHFNPIKSNQEFAFQDSNEYRVLTGSLVYAVRVT